MEPRFKIELGENLCLRKPVEYFIHTLYRPMVLLRQSVERAIVKYAPQFTFLFNKEK